MKSRLLDFGGSELGLLIGLEGKGFSPLKAKRLKCY